MSGTLAKATLGFRAGVLLLACALLAGCGEGPSQAIRMGLASAPITLDPRYATDATSARLNRLLYDRLVDFDSAARPVPALARWEQLSATHYRFHLRAQRATFHDGTPVDADDVRATYASVLDPARNSPHRSSLQMIERIAVIDADTVDFHLGRPDPLFPGYLVIGILPREGIEREHPFDRRPLGSGPFRFAAWPAEGLLRLERRRDGQLFEFVHVSDSTVRVLKLLRGELDLLQNDLPPELVRYLEGQAGIAVHHRQGGNFSYLGFNFEDPALADVRVRRAIAHAIDRAAIARHLLGGETRLASALLPPEHWASGGLDGLAYDPARARALLAEAGYGPRRPLRLNYRTTSDPVRLRIATVIQRQLHEVGIDVELSSFDWATFYADIKAGRFQLYSLSWVGIKSPDVFRYVFHSASLPPAGANRGRFRDSGVDGLIEAAEQAHESGQRARLYRALQRRLLETLPYV
ncbi:MAG TPA: ABC transporter substrate-binding protein, partial [Alphaproteobacteria bacterium]|nr:ABC transporter substrate-binding protein [Alphaproteobacteria bacterium]